MLMIASCMFHFHQATAAALNGLQLRLASVQSWMSTNKLKLNPDKTEFLLIGNERQQGKYRSIFLIEPFSVKTYPAKSARDLGVIFDKNFNCRSHIFAICSAYFYHFRDPRRIRRYLHLNGAKLLANALVASRLDYCNSLWSGIADTDLTKLRRVQIDWLVLWLSHRHILAVEHCYYIGM